MNVRFTASLRRMWPLALRDKSGDTLRGLACGVGLEGVGRDFAVRLVALARSVRGACARVPEPLRDRVLAVDELRTWLRVPLRLREPVARSGVTRRASSTASVPNTLCNRGRVDIMSGCSPETGAVFSATERRQSERGPNSSRWD